MERSRRKIRANQRKKMKQKRFRFVLICAMLFISIAYSWQNIRNHSTSQSNTMGSKKIVQYGSDQDKGGDSEQQILNPTTAKSNMNNLVEATGFSDKLQKISKVIYPTAVYDHADQSAKVIRELTEQAYVKVYGTDGRFAKVKIDGQTGYVAVENLKDADIDQLKIRDGVLIVNKEYGLPKDYAPGVDYDALQAFTIMKDNAEQNGIIIKIASDFRSFELQSKIFSDNNNEYGESATDRASAKPGYSEHQSGLAFDFMGEDYNARINEKFDNTKEAKWLAENAHKFGFILRYPADKEEITGYMYESWHYRYVGTEIATILHQNNLTLEEYFKLQ